MYHIDMVKQKSVSDYAAQGGKARAKALSKEERQEIARHAAQSRWAKEGKTPLPKATHTGPLKIGDIEFDCAVLEDGTRVISETRFMAAMGMYRSGAVSVRREGAPIPLFLAHKNLKPYVEKHLGGVHFDLVRYRTERNMDARGIAAELLPKVCEIWLDANKDGVLGKRQVKIAEKAEILMRGLAHVGIIALVDEVTGYQASRAKDALTKILERFIAEELRKWVKTFPDEFYGEMFRLREWDYPTTTVKKPALVGKLTNNIVYQRLAPGVLEELKRRTPRDEKGRHKTQLHRPLSEDVGHPRLREHLAAVIALMKASSDWDGFIHMLNTALPKYNTTKLLEFR